MSEEPSSTCVHPFTVPIGSQAILGPGSREQPLPSERTNDDELGGCRTVRIPVSGVCDPIGVGILDWAAALADTGEGK